MTAHSRREALVVGGLCCAAGAFASLHLGQDANWDLQNYHLYNAWAALQGGRFGIDAHPAVAPSYLNPSLDVLVYPLLMGMPDRWGGAIFGALHGLPAFLVYLLALETLGRERRNALLAALAALTGATSAMALSQIGTTFHDLTTSTLVLTGLLIAMRAADDLDRPPASRRLLLAGLLVGLAVGLKLTNAIYAAGFVVALACSPLRRRRRIVAAVLAAVAIGVALSYGWWGWTLYSHFGSPVFPLANSLFQSPLYPAHDLAFPRFFPRSVLEWIFYPFYFATNHRTAEVAFRDFRMAAAYLAVALIAIAWARRKLDAKPANASSAGGSAFAMLLGFFVASYVVWLVAFSTQRYATTLELLAPLVCILALSLFARAGARTVLALVLCALLMATTRPADWKRVPWDGNRYSAAWNFDAELAGQTAIVANTPLAFLAPTSGLAQTSWIGMPFNARDRQRIESLLQGRRSYVLAFPESGHRDEARKTLRELGIGVVAPCVKFATKLAGYVLQCRAAPAGVFDPARFENRTERWSFRASAVEPEVRLARGARAWIALVIENTGAEPLWANVPDTLRLAGLPAREDAVGEVNLAYHLHAEDGRMVLFEGERTSLPRSIAPGEKRRMWMRVAAPAAAGRYLIKPDVVMEGVRWAQEAMQGAPIAMIVD